MKLKVQDYLKNSTIHGLIYTSTAHHVAVRYLWHLSLEKYQNLNFNFFFRFFWALSLIVSAVCTLHLISGLVTKFINIPIVVYLSDKSVPVSEVAEKKI
jgi:hypothetical protein